MHAKVAITELTAAVCSLHRLLVVLCAPTPLCVAGVPEAVAASLAEEFSKLCCRTKFEYAAKLCLMLP